IEPTANDARRAGQARAIRARSPIRRRERVEHELEDIAGKVLVSPSPRTVWLRTHLEGRAERTPHRERRIDETRGRGRRPWVHALLAPTCCGVVPLRFGRQEPAVPD